MNLTSDTPVSEERRPPSAGGGPRAARAREWWFGGRITRGWWFGKREAGRSGSSCIDGAGWLWPPRMTRTHDKGRNRPAGRLARARATCGVAYAHARHQHAGNYHMMRVGGAAGGAAPVCWGACEVASSPLFHTRSRCAPPKEKHQARRNANGERISPFKRPREEKTSGRSKPGGAGRYGGWHART